MQHDTRDITENRIDDNTSPMLKASHTDIRGITHKQLRYTSAVYPGNATSNPHRQLNRGKTHREQTREMIRFTEMNLWWIREERRNEKDEKGGEE